MNIYSYKNGLVLTLRLSLCILLALLLHTPMDAQAKSMDNIPPLQNTTTNNDTKIITDDSKNSTTANKKIITGDSKNSITDDKKIITDDSKNSIADDKKIITDDSKNSIIANKKIITGDSKNSITDDKKIITDDSKNSIIADKNPITDDSKSITADKNPITSDSKPTTDDKNPITSDSKSTTDDKNPITGDSKNSIIADKNPITGDSKNSSIADKNPITGDTKNGYGGLYDKKEVYQVLSSYDEELYRQIYKYQNNSQWKSADKLIAKLHNKILLGYVLANRYLHWDYRTTFGQNQRWLEKYSHLVIALDIYKLAKRKRPSRYRHLKNWQLVLPSRQVRGINYFRVSLNAPAPTLRSSRSSRARRYRRLLKTYLHKGLTLSAKKMLQNKTVKRTIYRVQYDKYATELAMDYFINNHIRFAKKWAIEASDRSGNFIPKASFIVGMIYWLESDWKNAKKYFERSYNAKYATVIAKAKYAFWAGRADLNLRNSQGAWSWFVKSTKYPFTFYSLLAYDMLGQKFPFQWKIQQTKRLTEKEQHGVHTSLALALIQIGKDQLAGNELLSVWNGQKPELQSKMTYIIAQNDMASASYRLGNYLGRRLNNINTGLLYPTPKSWKPLDKYTVDPALMFALMRQESQFNIYAKSYVDARGLLQLMPNTASFIGRDRRWQHHWKYKLFTPSENIKLGEKYVTSLEKERYIKDIIGLLMSWNAGPGNYLKWRKKIKYRTNPLMFIEGIPSEQTRNFVKLVLTNFWIYRSRLGEDLLSLHQISQGKWPTLSSNHIIVK